MLNRFNLALNLNKIGEMTVWADDKRLSALLSAKMPAVRHKPLLSNTPHPIPPPVPWRGVKADVLFMPSVPGSGLGVEYF